MNKQLFNGVASLMMSVGMCTAPLQVLASYIGRGRDASFPPINELNASSVNSYKSAKADGSPAKQQAVTSPALDVYLQSPDNRNTAEKAEHYSNVALNIHQHSPVKELVIIDQAVPDKHLFYRDLKPGTEIVEVNSEQNGLTQLKNILSRYQNLDALHIVSHGADGVVYLGASQITESLLKEEVDTLSALDGAMKEGADLLFYGCELAKSQKGLDLLELISGTANIDVAASDDNTGSGQFQSDWELEINQGSIESGHPFSELALKDFHDTLAFTTVYSPNTFCDSGNCTTPVTSGDLTLNAPYQVSDYATTALYITGNNAEATFTFTITDTNALSSFELDSLSLLTYSGANACDITIEGFYAANDASVGTNTITKTDANNGAVSISNITGKALNKFTVKVCSGGVDSGQANHGISGFTLSNHVAPQSGPTISGVTYDSLIGNLVVTGTNFEAKSGAANDITVNKLTLTGEGGGGSAYTLTSATNVERDSSTQFTVPLSGMDKLRVDALLNKNNTSADDGTTYNLAAADDFVANVTTGNTAIATSGITVSNYAKPTFTSATYDASTGSLVVTGARMSSVNGGSNDVIANKVTLSGTGGDAYTLTDTANVDIASSTAFTLTLSATDKRNVNGILNKDLLSSDGGHTYNIAVADNWMAGGAGNVDIKDLTGNAVNVSNSANPAVTSASYNAGSGALTVTGTNFVSKVGASDIDLTKLTLKGEGTNIHTLISGNVEITDATSFSVTLSAADKLIVNGLLNKNGTQADDGSTTYNLNAADDYMVGSATVSQNFADATNAITVSGVGVPSISSATYNAATKQLVVTGTGFVSKSGANNDINVSLLTLTGEGSATYTLTSPNVEVTSGTQFTVTLNDTDKINVNGLFNADGTQSGDNTTLNIAVAEDWLQGAANSAVIADTTGNSITVSNTAPPAITSATYDAPTGVLVATGTRFVKKDGATNDVDVTKLIIKGQASGTHTLTTANVEITNETSFSVTLNSGDKVAVSALLNQNGTQSEDAVVYNLNAAEDWMQGAAATTDISDATNGITVSLDTTPPADPVIVSPTVAQSVSSTSFSVSGSHSENGVTVKTYVDADNDGAADSASVLGSSVVVANAWSITLTLAANSGNNFVVVAEDSAGNTSNAVDVVTITHTTPPPPAPNPTPTPDPSDDFFEDNNASTDSAESNRVIKVPLKDGQGDITSTAEISTDTSLTPQRTVEENKVSLAVDVTDQSGDVKSLNTNITNTGEVGGEVSGNGDTTSFNSTATDTQAKMLADGTIETKTKAQKTDAQGQVQRVTVTTLLHSDKAEVKVENAQGEVSQLDVKLANSKTSISADGLTQLETQLPSGEPLVAKVDQLGFSELNLGTGNAQNQILIKQGGNQVSVAATGEVEVTSQKMPISDTIVFNGEQKVLPPNSFVRVKIGVVSDNSVRVLFQLLDSDVVVEEAEPITDLFFQPGAKVEIITEQGRPVITITTKVSQKLVF